MPSPMVHHSCCCSAIVFEQGLYILVEPETALSPQWQLSFLKIIHDLEVPGLAQFIIASHSPILLAYPGATLYVFSTNAISKIDIARQSITV